MRARGLDFAVWTTPAVPDGRPPLACVNGGLLFDHRVLWPALQPLAARRQLVFYDQRGRGETPAPPGVRAARVEHDAGDLAALGRALRAVLGFDRWDVLGHSWGGGVAMLAAAEDTGGGDPAVGRLVLVNPVGATGDWLPGLHDRGLARLAERGDRAAYDALAAFDPARLEDADPALHAEYARAFYPAWFASAELAGLLVPPRAESVTGATVAARLRREGYDWRAVLRGVRAPSVVVHGEADLIAPAVARSTVAGLADGAPARLHLVADVGHLPFWEAPAEFVAAVESFLERPTLPP